MTFWEKIEKDIRKNIQDSLTLFRKRSTAVSQKIEKLTEEGKKKYKAFTLKMKVQDEFTKLGGKVYDLSSKSANPIKNKSVSSIISKIKKLETQITGMEKKTKTAAKRTKKRTKKRTNKKTVRKPRSTR